MSVTLPKSLLRSILYELHTKQTKLLINFRNVYIMYQNIHTYIISQPKRNVVTGLINLGLQTLSINKTVTLYTTKYFL